MSLSIHTSAPARVYPVDSFHAGIRLAALAALVAGFVLVAVGLPALLEAARIDGLPTVALVAVIGVAVGAGLAWLAEHLLQRVWPSGRAVEISGQHIAQREPSGAEAVLDWALPVEVTAWGFVVSTRKARVPRGWYCMAVRLAQGDRLIVPYTFMKPAQAEALPARPAFELLAARSMRGEMPGAARPQASLLACERERWQVGVEMRPEDFMELLDVLQAHVTSWLPGGAR